MRSALSVVGGSGRRAELSAGRAGALVLGQRAELPRRRAWRALLPLLVAASGSLAASAPTSANIAASRRAPAELGGPDAFEETPLRVLDEVLSFDCRRADDVDEGVACAFEARYRVENPTEGVEVVAAAFYGIRTRGVVIEVDGVVAGRELTSGERAQLDARVAAAQTGLAVVEGQLPDAIAAADRRHWGFELEVAPRQRREVVVRGVVDAGRFFRPEGHLLKPARARHRWLGGAPRPETFDVDYLLAPIRTWGGTGPIEVRVTFPAEWGFRGGVGDPGAFHKIGERAPWERRGEAMVLLTDAQAGARLSLSFTLPAAELSHGGPLVGAGWVFGRGGGLRARAGWEIAAPEWLLIELSADLDLSGALTVTPTFKLASPQVYVIPSLSLGLGAPFRLAPRLDQGLRLQADAHFTALAVVASFDVFPGLDAASPDFFEAALLGQISF